MGRATTGLLALALGASVLTGTANAALAYPPIACRLVPNAPLPSNVCAGVSSSSQVSGFANYFGEGTVTWDDIYLVKCNSAGAACAVLPGSHRAASSTLSFPASATSSYYSCVSYHVRVTPTITRYYSGCSPLAAFLA